MSTDNSLAGKFSYKSIALIIGVAVATLYFTAIRTGRIPDLFNVKPASEPEMVVMFDDYPRLKFISGKPGQIVCGDGTRFDRDGYGYVLFQPADWDKNNERLKGLGLTPASSDFPLLITLNPSAFDVSGEPVAVRRAEDGKLLYQAPVAARPVDLVMPLRDGSCKVLFIDGKVLTVSEQEWLKVFMRVQAAPPQGFEKMSDAELKKHGFERLSPEEVDKRLKEGKLKPDQVFPMPRVPERSDK